MRSPERIGPILDKIYSYWIHCPDLRLGQLIYDVTNHAGYSDVFFIEDDKLSEALDDYFKFLKEKQ